MERKTIGLLAGTALTLAFGVHDASAAKRQVGTCTTNPLQYSTIQGAVDAANAGDVVQICPGIYPEEVTVAKSIGLTNVPAMANPTVAIPAGGAVQNITKLSGEPGAAQIAVIGTKAYVKNLVVDGAGNNINQCGFELVGIYFQNAGGTIQNNTVQNQLLPSGTEGCQSGQGIYVQSVNAGTPAMSIVGNNVSNFDKNGITINEPAATGTIKNNTVTGTGPVDYIAQNGIQVGFGASAHVIGNTVSNLDYSPNTDTASGILFYGDDASTDLTAQEINSNTVSSAQIGIVLVETNGTAGKMAQIASNNVSGAFFGGIVLDSDTTASSDYIRVAGNIVTGTSPYDDIDVCSDHNTILKNTVSSSTEGGIHLDGLCQEPDNSTTGVNNVVSTNQIDDNCVGILSGPPVGANTIKSNSFASNTNNYEYGTDSFSCSTAKHRGVSRHLVPVGSVRPLR